MVEHHQDSDMKPEAICLCQQYIEYQNDEIDVPKLAKRARRYPDRKGHFASFIPMQYAGRLAESLESLRAWLTKYPSVKATLIDANFNQLMKTEAFRE